LSHFGAVVSASGDSLVAMRSNAQTAGEYASYNQQPLEVYRFHQLFGSLVLQQQKRQRYNTPEVFGTTLALEIIQQFAGVISFLQATQISAPRNKPTTAFR
jgi:signal transduction protein with GAF and PtsI domain